MKQWKIPDKCWNLIVDKLKEQDFINLKRYAQAFAHDKFLLNKWGKRKIRYELKNKNIPENFINEALDNIDQKAYFYTCLNLAQQKHNLLKTKYIDNKKIKQKIFEFLYNKGYESSIINQIFFDHLKIDDE